MPINVSQRRLAVFWLLLRLVVFVGVTYLAEEWLLLRGPKVQGFTSTTTGALGTDFRTPGVKSETRSLKVFGGTLWGVTTEREEMLHGRRNRAKEGRHLLWVKEEDGEFFPRGGAIVYAREGTNYIEYSVMHPVVREEWMFKVEHRITKNFRVGPFRFRQAPSYVIYESPVMTNTLSPQDPPKSESTRHSRRENSSN